MSWITDPEAIDTVLALGELRLGDEILIHGDGIIDVSHRDNGKTGVVTQTNGHKYVGTTYPGTQDLVIAFVVVVEDSSRTPGWYICRRNIAGWRRPIKEKEHGG